MRTKTFLLSLGLGIGASSIVFALTLVSNISLLMGGLVLSGTPTASFLSWALPTEFWYWLVPDGGGNLALPLFAFSAWFQLVVLFSSLFYVLLRRRSKRALETVPASDTELIS